MADMQRRQNPRASSNFISSLFMLFMIPIFYESSKKDITENDLFEPLNEHKATLLGEQLDAAWKRTTKKNRNYRLHYAMLRVFGYEIFMVGFLACTKEIIAVVFFPYLIGKLISFFNQPQEITSDNPNIDLAWGYYYTIALIGAMLLERVMSHPMYMWSMHLGMKMRVACNALIYRKILRMSKYAMAQSSVGHVVNLASNDVGKFDMAVPLMHYSWIAPVQAIVGLVLLYSQIGLACFIGFAFLVLLLPLQTLMAKRTMMLRRKTAIKTDERVRLMNEIISGIQVIKMYVWEKSFAKLVDRVRRKELQAIRSTKYLRAITYALETIGTRIAIFISLIGYALLGYRLTAQVAFEVTAIYNVMKTPFMFLFTTGLSGLAEINVTLNRIQAFLDSEETPEKRIVPALVQNKEREKETKIQTKIILNNVDVSWEQGITDNTLTNITFSIDKPELLAVIGPVGCGKSTLLNVLLSELGPKNGTALIEGRISYCSQEPWLFSGSVRDNILYGEPFDERKYRKACKICALENDLQILSHGDKTLVGERGRALSGGQKARINLARAVYRDADIYILDDPLSAVDAHVGDLLFQQCIRGFLKEKIVVLVTHQLQYLQDADKILILKDGQIAGYGDFTEMQNKGLDFSQFIERKVTTEDKPPTGISRLSSKISRQSSISSEILEIAEIDIYANNPVVEKETVSAGKVTFSTYKRYFNAGENCFLLLLVFNAFVVFELVARIGDYFIAYWVRIEDDFVFNSNDSTISNDTNIERKNEMESQRMTLVYEYSGIMSLTVALAVFSNILAFYYLIRSSSNLHNYIFQQLVKARQHFFNINPVGRILNKFSMDMGIIDDQLSTAIVEVLRIAMLLLGTLVLTSTVNAILLPPALILLGTFYLLRLFYINVSRNVKRLEAVARSPVYNQMTMSMNGLSTIRAFSGQKRSIQEFDRFQDLHSSAWFLFVCSTRTFGFWLDLMCVIFLLIVTLCMVAFDTNKEGASIGLIITQYMGLLGAIQWGMRQWSEMENLMTSVERVLEYTQLENEPIRENPAILPKDWPQEGKLEFQDVSMRYDRSDEPVLKNISFIVQPAEKIGIVGRTGAGKSSIINAIFQLYDIEGAILIDNINITTLSLSLARTKVSIIPQDALLFGGTLRKNLDPFDEYSDDLLWNALEQVELKNVIAEMPHGLHTSIAEEGSNYSVGQRQLICLARAILRKNQILVLDEVTANVDPQTDALIQRTIRRHFAKCTTLTIAHRLHSIIDSDRILVMDAGKVAEFDTVHNLLQDKKGIFKSMVDASGISI